MKLLVISIWKDPYWYTSFRKSWKRRKYWFNKYDVPSNKGEAFALQFFDYTFKILIVRNNNG